MPRIEVNLRDALTGDGLRVRLKRIGILLQEQTLDRIEKGGDDEIVFAPLDFPRPTGDKANPLYSTGTHLFDSITYGVDGDNSVWVGSSMVGAQIHQHGTVGKSAEGVGPGTKDSIEPVQADALFIPLSTRAARSIPTMAGGGKKVRTTKVRKKGRVVDNDLEYGKDFILVDHVDINPRPFLRISRGNAEEIAVVIGTGDTP